MRTKFDIGDKVWYSQSYTESVWVECPDCLGSSFMTLIKGNGETVTIDCDCSVYSDIHGTPRGKRQIHQFTVNVEYGKIEGIEVKGNKVEYLIITSGSINSSYSGLHLNDDTAFATKEEAEAYAKVKVEEKNQEEKDSIYKKEKENQTWDWHVRHYGQEIRYLERQLEYYKNKTSVAKVLAKKYKRE